MKTMSPLNENEEKNASAEELDRMLKAVLREPEGLSARIRAAVHQGEEFREAPSRFRAWGWCASAAALLLIVAGFVFAGVGRKSPAGGQSATARVEASPANSAPSVEQPSSVRAEENRADYSSVSVASSVPQAVRLAGVGAGGTVSSSEDGTYEVMPVVLHRWMVKDVAEAMAKLDEYAKDHKLRSVSVDKEAASLGFLLSDRELQELVDWLHNGKWRLLSTQYPLPERGRDVRFTGAKVQYVIDLSLVP